MASTDVLNSKFLKMSQEATTTEQSAAMASPTDPTPSSQDTQTSQRYSLLYLHFARVCNHLELRFLPAVLPSSIHQGFAGCQGDEQPGQELCRP